MANDEVATFEEAYDHLGQSVVRSAMAAAAVPGANWDAGFEVFYNHDVFKETKVGGSVSVTVPVIPAAPLSVGITADRDERTTTTMNLHAWLRLSSVQRPSAPGEQAIQSGSPAVTPTLSPTPALPALPALPDPPEHGNAR